MAGNLNMLDCIQMEITALGNYDYTCTRGFEIVDVLAAMDASPIGGANTTLQRQALGVGAFNGVAGAINVGTVNQMVRADTFVDAQMTCAGTDILRALVAGAAAPTADIFIFVIPTTWIAG
jgi:hypothetical protein